MELTGSTADRWEQISNKINELAMGISAKQELVKGISSALEDLNAELDTERQTLEQLANLALKEVLREESGTLNDEPPVVPEPIQPKKTPAKKPAKKPAETQKQPETLPLLENVDNTESDQPQKQEN